MDTQENVELKRRTPGETKAYFEGYLSGIREALKRVRNLEGIAELHLKAFEEKEHKL